MHRYHLAAIAAAAVLAAPAFAQDAPAEAAAATGFRVEGIAGYEDASFDSARSGSGALYGVGVGYDLAAGRFRFGIEADASDSSADDCSVFGGNTICSRAGRDLYAGARVGGMISDNVLLYGKIGYTNFRETTRFTLGTAGGTTVTHPEFDGLRLGAGTEIAVGAKTFIKAEYRYSNYEAAKSFDRHQGVVGFGVRF